MVKYSEIEYYMVNHHAKRFMQLDEIEEDVKAMIEPIVHHGREQE